MVLRFGELTFDYASTLQEPYDSRPKLPTSQTAQCMPGVNHFYLLKCQTDDGPRETNIQLRKQP